MFDKPFTNTSKIFIEVAVEGRSVETQVCDGNLGLGIKPTLGNEQNECGILNIKTHML